MQPTTSGESTMVWERGDVVLIPFPYSDLNAIKTRPTYVLADWQAAGLLRPTVMKPRLATIQETLVRHHIGRLSPRDMMEVNKRLRRTMSLNILYLMIYCVKQTCSIIRRLRCNIWPKPPYQRSSISLLAAIQRLTWRAYAHLYLPVPNSNHSLATLILSSRSRAAPAPPPGT
jgi:mRNA-degrading endonuclease toxin of MazEF toxin-antitoxin module